MNKTVSPEGRTFVTMPQGLFASHFSISDLENLSGVKAHTIRMWERRFGLMKPSRTDTNIRHYNAEELQDLLNISFLNSNGVKISHIAAMSQEARESNVRELGAKLNSPSALVSELLMLIIRLDEAGFEERCDVFSALHGFRALAEQVFLPVMKQVGLLWQSKGLRPAQEHFASNLIRRRIEAETHALPPARALKGPLYVLYLRESEVHELGLLYANYLLRSAGKKVIYLGQSLPIQDLGHLMTTLPSPLILVTILTTDLDGGTEQFIYDVGALTGSADVVHWMTGSRALVSKDFPVPSNVRLFQQFWEMIPVLIETGP